MVDVRGDPPDRPTVARGEEQFHLRMLEERVVTRVEMAPALGDQGRDPLVDSAVQLEGKGDESPPLAARLNRHGVYVGSCGTGRQDPTGGLLSPPPHRGA